MREDFQPDNRLIDFIRPLPSEDGQSHLALEDWEALLHNSVPEAELERIGEHVTHCRHCSQILLEAEEYTQKVRDADVLARVTPRYIPHATPSRLILETAGSRIWVERVRGGWLLASMDMDVEVVGEKLTDAITALVEGVQTRSSEALETLGPVLRNERRVQSWLRTNGGKEWSQRFQNELPDAIEGATLRLRQLKPTEQQEEDLPRPDQSDIQLLSEAQIGEMPEDFNIALQLAQTMLNNVDHPADPNTIRRKVRSVLAMLRAEDEALAVDEELLVRELQARYTTYVGSWGILDDVDEKHRPWIHDRKAQINWRFWRRYERYLKERKGWVPASLISLNELTDTILDRLEDPTRPGSWDRRGMVVGSVQSGKTANYTGLICKAADAGFKLIIVMAGMHNNLRSQTQWRLDEGFLGWDTQVGRRVDNHQPNQKIGVGRLKALPWFTAPTLTSNAINGDFNRHNANQAGIVPGGNDPVLLVVKKNKSVLQNVRKWALQVLDEHIDGKDGVSAVPLLLIDDEADNASINTAERPRDRHGNILDDYDVTAINGEIRKLLSSFEQSAYVGYTATPFANIFIAPDAETTTHGRDIFPDSYIINMPAPSNYVGPNRVFGLAADALPGSEEVEGLPIVRTVEDYQTAFPTGHKKYQSVDELPGSLKTAMRAFIMTCAARRARGQKTDHNSMLVHVTRFIDVQKRAEELIKEELDNLQRQLEFANGNIGQQLLSELETLWKTDFEPTSISMKDEAGTRVTWLQVKRQLHEAASRIQTRVVNSDSSLTLDYQEHENGLSVIVIGGDKLSRGLTLEGLSVSYYLRATNMYDTLMQMGRWFGYRPGYLDLCRLYTTEDLVLWYRHIALADAELRGEFDYMESIGASPRDYALRVRTSPGGLLVTAINKMRDSVVMRLSYSSRMAESGYLHIDPHKVLDNVRVTDAFIRKLGNPKDQKRDNWIWSEVSGEAVVGFLNSFQSHPHTGAASTTRLAEYVTAQINHNELKNWTVALISNSQPDLAHSSETEIGGYKVVTTWRRPADNITHVYAILKGRIVNPTDEYLDFDDKLEAAALIETIAQYRRDPGRRTKEPTRPSGEVVRSEGMRSPEKGLLILYPLFPSPELYGAEVKTVIGYAVSFPHSPTAEGVEYRVGEQFWRKQIGDDDDDNT